MAMSLADELGGALDLDLDPHQDDGLSGNAGLGLSLADELELDLELDHQFSDPLGPSDHNQFLSPSPPTPQAKLGKSPARNRDRDTPHRARTSATSTYYTATASPGRLSALDSADEIDQSLYQLDEDQGLDSDTSARDEGSVPDLEMDGDQSRDSLFSINGAGLPTPKMDEDDIAAIEDHVADIARFVNSLKKIEPEPTLKADPQPVETVLSHSLNRSRPGSSTNQGKGGVLENYLDVVDKTGRASEEQAKEVSTIRQDFASVPPTPELIHGLLEILGPIDNPVEDPTVNADDSTLAIISEESAEEHDSNTPNPDESFITAHDPETETSTITDTMQEIISENKAIVSDLRSLSETVDLNQSIQTSIARQIKGLKNTLMTWEEREAMEERAKEAIEQWERSQVQRGLRGEKGTREVLDDVLKGFRRTLDDCERQMGAVRAKYAAAAA
jgi:hypothetical protein